MAFSLNSRITIGELTLRSVNEVEITSTWRELNDLATITLPNRGYFRANQNDKDVEISKVIKVGDPVRVELGYNGDSNTEFLGYVTTVKPGIPVVVECEDEVYHLKRSGLINKSYNRTTLKALLQEMVGNVKLNNLPEVSIENFLVENATKAQVLQELREKYGLSIYYRLGLLHAGLPFAERISKGTKLVIDRNVIEEDLEYREASDVRLKVQVTSIMKDNTKLELEFGDPDGETRKLFFYNINNRATLESLAKSELEKYKYTGYRGKVKTFGVPYIQHGEVVELQEPRYANRTGRYLVEKVVTTFGENGFRRDVELGIKVS